ncbi:MAG: 50S ribosomal protein L21 [Puniceicoccales bacterium]|jgi:large subunit ribosomal protein L21|nr:50S ribosomal protein L21 [Puniceicoccales bacterium]
MKAFVRVQGIQICATEGAIFEVNRFKGRIAGDIIRLNDVFLLGDGETARIGTPTIEGASVGIKILENKRGKKKLVIKRLRRKGFHKKRGHRQEISVIEIQDIQG